MTLREAIECESRGLPPRTRRARTAMVLVGKLERLRMGRGNLEELPRVVSRLRNMGLRVE